MRAHPIGKLPQRQPDPANRCVFCLSGAHPAPGGACFRVFKCWGNGGRRQFEPPRDFHTEDKAAGGQHFDNALGGWGSERACRAVMHHYLRMYLIKSSQK